MTTATAPAPVRQGRRGAEAEEHLGKAYDLALMRRLWRFIVPHKRLVWIAFLLIPSTIGLELAQPWLLKVAVTDYIAPQQFAGFGSLIALYALLVAAQAGSSYLEQWVLQLLGQRAMHDLRIAIYDHVLRQRTAFFDRMPVGRLMTRMTNDIESINEMFAAGVVTLLADFVKMLAIVGIMMWMSVQLTLMTFVSLPFLVILVNYARKLMRRSFREIRVRLAAMNAFLQEHLSGVRVVQLFRREAAARGEYDEINAGHRDAYLDSIRADAMMYALVEAIGVLAIGLVAWMAAMLAGAGPDTATQLGVVAGFIEYINKFFIPVRDLSAKYAVMQGAMAATERITQLLDMEEPDAPARAVAAAVVEDRAASLVCFDDVHFAYAQGEPVLRGVSFDIPRGATVAVVGATGSGKSTLIKLLTRLYEIEDGAIRLAGVDVRDQKVDELRRRVTVVSQDVFLFGGTVLENLIAGTTKDRAAAEQALVRVGADRVLARRPEGLDTMVADRGANFSAGERQLLAFARAMVRDPEVLVLDEATAHVDPESEGLIEKGIALLMRGRTTLVIAHRLSTIRNADLILVMSRGQIVERGTHDELVAHGGVYAALERTFSRRD
ncbi:MAG: ABC transporter ATP-binding protein/permease [Deltaproteobacteria bacterium]|nr:ABC transporter ATP-binding protein/permease [Deltaproteobacteria bacterium]